MAGFSRIEAVAASCPRGTVMPSRSSLAAALFLALSTGLATDPLGAADPSAVIPALNPMTAGAPGANPVVARIDGVELRLSDVEAAQQSLPQQAQKLPLAQVYPILLTRLVDGALVTEAGRKQHLNQDPTVQRRLQLYEDHLIQQAYVEQLIKGAATEDQLKARYQKFIQEKPAREEVHARHILVKTEAEAKLIIGELDKGAQFATLAKKYSTDPGAASGGDLGYFGRDDMVPAFAAAAFALPVGKYTETPVKTEFGWHVILVEDHRIKKPPSFDEARPEMSQLLARDVVQAKLKELRAAANIETFGLDGKPITPTK
jgi:peptidyl-prolyl cis-trans isomerase C